MKFTLPKYNGFADAVIKTGALIGLFLSSLWFILGPRVDEKITAGIDGYRRDSSYQKKINLEIREIRLDVDTLREAMIWVKNFAEHSDPEAARAATREQRKWRR